MIRSRIFIIATALLSAAFSAAAQLPSVSGDELVHAGIEAEIDSTLYGRDIFSVLPDDVVVQQPSEVRDALNASIAANEESSFNGFRIRIYISSSPSAREESLETLLRFNRRYPYIQAYRSYTSPNFKVSVGNFRTRVDAEILLREIQEEFPDAFIARERFKYPSMGAPDLRTLTEESSSGQASRKVGPVPVEGRYSIPYHD